MPPTHSEEGEHIHIHKAPSSQSAESESLVPPSRAGSPSWPSVQEIPEEVLSSILGRVSEGTGGLGPAGVCRRWRRVSSHSQRRLSVPVDVPEGTLMALLARYPNVRVVTFDGSARGRRRQLVPEPDAESPDLSAELEHEEEDLREDSQAPFLAKGLGGPQRQGPLLGWAFRSLSRLGTARGHRPGQGLRPRHGRGVAPVCSASVPPRASDGSGGAPGRQ